MAARRQLGRVRRLVVKVGTSLITEPGTGPDPDRIAALAAEIAGAREGRAGVRSRSAVPARGESVDVVLVTSDNPRGEDPRAIIEEILPGVRQALTGDPGGEPDAERCLVIPDRKEAIRRALGLARPGDCVVIAGKGHETYQILGTRTIPFDDREVAREVLRAGARAAGGQGIS